MYPMKMIKINVEKFVCKNIDSTTNHNIATLEFKEIIYVKCLRDAS